MIPAEDPAAFAVSRSDSTTVMVVTVIGEIDADESAILRAEALAAVEEACAKVDDPARPPLVVLDLTGVTFLGSIGLSTLLYVARTAARRGAELRGVTGEGNRAVTRPLKLTGVGGNAAWYPTLDEATSSAGMH